MKRARNGLASAAAAALLLASMPQMAPAAEGETLQPFRSEAELRRFLERAIGPQRAARAAEMAGGGSDEGVEAVVVTGSRQRDSITNNQEAGVDEGGIVKARGDLLVILRRGRLFTVSVANGELRPVDRIDASPPGVEAGWGDWYDEMLLLGDRVVVIGYSRERGGTEINRFRIDSEGRLSFEDAHQLKSNDYYSSRNYASRLIGDELVTYAPLDLEWDTDPLESLPGLRRWSGGGDREAGAFEPIARPRDIFIAPQFRRDPRDAVDTLHAVTRCNLAAAVLSCSAKGVLGSSSRSFYVSRDAIYLWTSANQWGERPDSRGAEAHLFRMPLGRGAPQGVAVRGSPVDQFSFQEDARARTLNVLVRSEGGGDAMWRPEFTDGAVALLRLPLGSFGDSSREAPTWFYRPLPSQPDDGYGFTNRFIGDHLVYAQGGVNEGGELEGSHLVAAPVRGGAIAQFKLAHGVGRVEAIGRDAMIVGGKEGELTFTTLELGRTPRLGPVYRHPLAEEAETRSHAFFFRPDGSSGGLGVLALPVSRPAPSQLEALFGSTSEMLFLRRTTRGLAPLGLLPAATSGVVNDECRASCTDWYGNARPIFLGNRVFALLGYELVEGEITTAGIRELRRASFAPPPAAPSPP